MYNYPLKFSFGMFSLTPKIKVTDASGKVIMTASKKLLSSKEEIPVNLNGTSLFQITSQESRLSDIPSNWDITTAEGEKIGTVDDDYLSAIDTSSFVNNRVAGEIAEDLISRQLNLQDLKMYWLLDTAGNKVGLIAPEKKSLVAQQLPLYDIVRKLPLFFRFITPGYYIRMNEKTVMYLQKKKTLMVDTYDLTLEESEGLTEEDEKLLLPSVLLTLVYERQQLKDSYQ
ncbi:MAG: hypothetical protein DWQ07_04310 [Chloroflexi bacterium]|nr:MAG: hypothetical protein DWQ07_04310 [Chloroflexota bacterium]MBL1194656.1 hypothetical protein [Chloroflexota bacterium]